MTVQTAVAALLAAAAAAWLAKGLAAKKGRGCGGCGKCRAGKK
jgi:hypothetical protein